MHVLCGTGTGLEAEGRDRTDLNLPGNQLQILKDAIFYSKDSHIERGIL